jgi:hypothetical protein
MRKNIFLILVLVAIFAFIGAMNQSAKAVDDPIEIIKNAKTPVNLHSLAGGIICNYPYSDSLVNDRPTQICSWWESIYPHNTFGAKYHVDNQNDNGTPGLNPSDWLNLHHYWPNGDPGGTVWVHVEDVMITLILTKEPAHLDTMYVEFVKSYKDVGSLFVNEAIFPPVEGDTLHEKWPEYSNLYVLSSWIDSGLPFGQLSCSDTIDITGPLPASTVTYWHVEDVAIDIAVLSNPYPQTPTMTQWGLIILVALIVGSAVFIMLRRRRAVPA